MSLSTTDSKPWYASTTIWGSVLAIAAPVLAMVFKTTIDAATQGAIADWMAGVGALVGGAIAIWGRFRAVKTIG